MSFFFGRRGSKNRKAGTIATVSLMVVAFLFTSVIVIDADESDAASIFYDGTAYYKTTDGTLTTIEFSYEGSVYNNNISWHFPFNKFNGANGSWSKPFLGFSSNSDGSGSIMILNYSSPVDECDQAGPGGTVYAVYDEDATWKTVVRNGTYTFAYGETVALKFSWSGAQSLYFNTALPYGLNGIYDSSTRGLYLSGIPVKTGEYMIGIGGTGPDDSELDFSFKIVVEESKSYSVSFSSNGSVIQTQTVDDGMTASSFNPTLDGYTFKGWYVDGAFSSLFDFSTPITSDKTLYAKWEGNFAFTSEPTAEGTITNISSMNGTVVFDASASEGSIIVWDFGDGSTATGMYQTHYYAEPGMYSVKLFVYNDNGDVDMKEYSVSIPDVAVGGGDLMSVTSSSCSSAYSEVVWSSEGSSEIDEIAGGII